MQVVGVSEAERMRMKAAVYKKYGDAAILNLVLTAMPKVKNKYILDQYYNYGLNLVLALGSRDEIKDQIFIKPFGRRCGPSSVIYFRSIKNINLLYKRSITKMYLDIFTLILS